MISGPNEAVALRSAPGAAEQSLRVRPYVLIMGCGRSGSNRLLDILDRHERTFCRNEPHGCLGGAFHRLPSGLFPEDLDDAFPRLWGPALETVSSSFGERDRFDIHHKAFFRTRVHAGLGQWIMAHGRVRRAFANVWPELSGEEWPAPRFHVSTSGIQKALPVLKVLEMVGWALRTHEADQGQVVLHIMRPPKGYLRSWWNRYVPRAEGGPEELWRVNRKVAERIAARFGVEGPLPEAASREALVESQLWRWRHVNETLFTALGGSNRYLPILNDRIDAAPEAEARRVYAFLGLDFAPRHARRVAGLRNVLFGSRPHTDTLEEALIRSLSTKVLKGSPLPRWFEENGAPIL